MTDNANKLYSMKSAKISKHDASSDSEKKSSAVSQKDQDSSRMYSTQVRKGSAAHANKQDPEKKAEKAEKSETHDAMEKTDMKNLGPDETKNDRLGDKEKKTGTSGSMSARPLSEKPVPGKSDAGRQVPSRPLKTSNEAEVSTKQTEPKSSQPSGRTERPDHAEPAGESGKTGQSSVNKHDEDSTRTKSPAEQTTPTLRPKHPPLQRPSDGLSGSHTEQADLKEGNSELADHSDQKKQTDQPPKNRTQYKKKIKGVKDIQKNRKRRRLIMIITAVTLVVAIGAAYYVYQVQQQQAAAAAADQARQVYQVTREIYQEEVDISGNVTAYDSRQPYFRMSGTVEAVYAEEGDRIEAGELIAELDDTEIQYELAQLDYQIEQNELEGSLRQLELNRMQRNILESRLEKTKLFAPISGTLTELNIEAGDMVNAGSSTAAGKIVDVSALKASVEVDEYDINRVKVGQRAELTFDALGDETEVEAVVDSIPLEGNVTSEGIAVKYIDLVIEEVPEGISPSYSFSGVILAGEEQEILTVPENAVIEQPDGTEVLMVQRNDESVVPVQVTTKKLNDGSIRILSGNVSAGDTVVVTNEDADGFPMPGGGAPFPGMGGGRR